MTKKVNLLIPIAGKGQRFVDAGFNMPKQLIMAGGKHLIDWSMDSIDYSECNLIFVIRDEHVYNFAYDKILKKKYGADIKIVSLKQLTQGSVCSCLEAAEHFSNGLPLVIFTMDVGFRNIFDPTKVDPKLDGLLLTFKSNSPNYSYAQTDVTGKVIKTAEKEVISDNAAVGIYYFRNGDIFIKYAQKMIELDLRTKNEFYISPLYNLLIEDGLNIGIQEVEKMYIFGTPDELKFYKNVVLKKFGQKPIGICSDHSGYEMKEKLKEVLTNNNLKYIDFGTYTDNNCDYMDFVSQAANAIKEGDCDFGIALCRSGQGVNLAANSFEWIRSSLIYSKDAAKMTVKHNAPNFFSLPAGYIAYEDLNDIISALMNETFDGGRHQARIQKIQRY